MVTIIVKVMVRDGVMARVRVNDNNNNNMINTASATYKN